MPTTDLNQRVKRIVGLSEDETNLLLTIVATEDDLRYLDFIDLPEGLPIVKRRKLEIIVKYLAKGFALEGMLTMSDIQEKLNAPAPSAATGASTTMITSRSAPDPGHGAPRMYTDSLPTFSGNPIDYEEWERKKDATIKQTVYKTFITRAARAGDVVEEARSQELFNMYLSSVAEGSALNIVEKARDDNGGTECGFTAGDALKKWYLDDTQKEAMITHWSTKLDNLLLDEDTTATDFINTFEICVRKLVSLGEAYSDEKQVREFRKKVKDPDYETEVRTHSGKFEDLVKTIRKREQELELDTKQRVQEETKIRRFQRTDSEGTNRSNSKDGESNKGTSHGNKQPYIPFLPGFLVRSLDRIDKENILKWRGLVNKGKTMESGDLVRRKRDDDDTESDSEKPSKNQAKKKRKKSIRRVTKVRRIGLADDTVRVRLSSSDDDSSSTDDESSAKKRVVSFRDDGNGNVTPGQKVGPDKSSGKKTKKKLKITRHLRKEMSKGMSNGRKVHHPYAVIDPGAEHEVIGGVGWRIMHFSDDSESLGGALEGMGTAVLPKVDAITAVEDNRGKIILLGVGGAGYDSRTSQYETLLNSHHLRANGIVVDDVAKEVGGKQRLQLESDGKEIDIPLDFNGDIMRFFLRPPTEEELVALRVTWLTPPMENITPQSLRRHKRAIEDFQLKQPSEEEKVGEEEISVSAPQSENNTDSKKTLGEWKALLAFPSDKVVEKTLESTTQLQDGPVEVERREIPKNHRKKRLLMLHPRRLQGRTDSDTVFSTVKSIRGYNCMQVFCHVMSDFLFVRCMQRESHSHGAYEDYIREVGASELIVTDNSKTQTGKKWEKTSRLVMTKQRRFEPHHQNQSKVERRIQDLKHKTVLVLQRQFAPLEFWCYALLFVVDCLNHLAKESLGWRTSTEVLNGDTADISPFRFTFWQPIKFYDKSGFPNPTWVMGRFLGIAWDTGDQFTFRVWSEPDGDWKKGGEFTRSVVRSRDASEIPESKGEAPDVGKFKFQCKRRSRKRKRSGKTTETFVLTDIPDITDDMTSEPIQRSGNDADENGVTATVDPAPKVDHNQVQNPGGEKAGTTVSDITSSPIPSPLNISTTTDTANLKTGPISEENLAEIEMTEEVNNQLSRPDEKSDIGGSNVMEIVAHDWKFGHLHFKVKWSSGETTWEMLKDMKEDHPKLTARYIVMNKVSRSNKRGGDRVLQWAKKVERDIERAVRRIVRLYDFFLDDDDEVKLVRRNIKKKKKKFSTKPVFKYGIQVPRTVAQAKELDEANGNTLWQDAIDKEVNALLELKCFEFHPANHAATLDDSWQATTLHMVFDVKQSLARKCRMVAGGHLVDMLDIQVYSSTVKSISVQLLHVLSHKAGLTQLCGDIGNAFPNAYTKEKVYVRRAGPEFGKYEGMTIIIVKALYGLCSSSERFHAHLADTLRSFGFTQTRFDNDVWIRLDQSGKTYEYICTHVDDFMICSRDPERVMKEIESVYLVKDSSKGPPSYYLGNDYKKDKRGRWCVGCKTYITEAVRRIEALIGRPLPKKDTPMPDGDHPEEDKSSPLDDEGHRQFQMLIGMLNWIVCIGRLDIAFSTASLSRFTACPREGHRDRAYRVFGYLKKYRNRRIVVDSRSPILEGGVDALEKDYTEIFKDFYPDAAEELDAKLPIPLIDELDITAFVDSDHAHDKVTRRSMTGLIILVGRTPVFFMSKRQGAIETSTYGAEFCAMRTAVEEVQAVRYMLRCLGVKVLTSSLIVGDNMGVIQNCTIADSLLKKKHVAIAFHKTREAAAAGIVHPIKTRSEHNFSDLCTKSVTGKSFWALYGALTRG